MPLQPSTYVSGPVSPQQLNTDLYTFGNANFNATGILWHTHRPMQFQSVVNGGTAYSSLIAQPVAGAGLAAYTVVDNTALFSVGADNPGTYAFYRFGNNLNGAGGSIAVGGGNWLTWNYPVMGPVSNPPGGVGAGLGTGNTMIYIGTFQYGSTAQRNTPYYLDLLNTINSSILWQPFFWWLTASTPLIIGYSSDPSSDNSGTATRQGWLWEGINSDVGGTVAVIPSPQVTWGTVTSAALNSSIGSTLTFLNNPPMLRTITTSGQLLGNGVATAINFPTPTLDNYNGFSTALTHYVAPLPGLYLFSTTLVYGTASSSGIREASLQTNAGGTQTIWKGSTYMATPVGPGVSGVGLTSACTLRIFSLNQGDSVTAVGLQNSGGGLNLYTGFSSRLIGAYMAPQAAAGTVISGLTVPATGFRWQAGLLSGTALTAALNLHLGNDLNFLMNKPYFTGYQQTAQTGFANNSGFHKVTIDTVGAFPRGGNSDNWAGWSTANSWYVSQLAGWYLVIADVYATPPATGTTGVLTAGIFISSSGTITPGTTPDNYQQVAFPTNGSRAPGATGIGLYYLLPGEHVYPMISTLNWGTWGTYVTVGSTQTVYSQFSCFWVAP
jgi:hypothetical protein